MVVSYNKGPIEAIARDIMGRYGSPSHALFLDERTYKSALEFRNGSQYELNSSMFTFGYTGTGCDNTSYLLEQLGFAKIDLSNITCPARLSKDGKWLPFTVSARTSTMAAFFSWWRRAR